MGFPIVKDSIFVLDLYTHRIHGAGIYANIGGILIYINGKC